MVLTGPALCLCAHHCIQIYIGALQPLRCPSVCLMDDRALLESREFVCLDPLQPRLQHACIQADRRTKEEPSHLHHPSRQGPRREQARPRYPRTPKPSSPEPSVPERMMTAASSSSASGMSPALSESDRASTQELLEALYAFGKGPSESAEDNAKLSKLLRHTDHAVGGASERGDAASAGTRDDAEAQGGYTITSWKMQDYAYKRDPCPYPTRARGLFTVGTERIIARAYDKFFNVDEVTWTKVGWLFASLARLASSPRQANQLTSPSVGGPIRLAVG